jgi:hypothetical protein
VKRLTVCLLLVCPVAAQAQSPKIEIGVGVAISGPSSAGATRTELLDSAGRPVTLFEATHRTSVGPGLDAGLMFRLRPRVGLELSGSWVRPDLKTTISGDIEGAGDTTLSLGMHRFSAEAALVKHFGRKGATEPYLRAGGGWFRELTTDRALVDDGATAHVGGGLKYWVREGGAGWFGHMAFRADVRLVMHHGGIAIGDASTRWSPAASAGLVLTR